MTRKEFRRQLGELQSVITRGFLYHAVWQTLWPKDTEINILIRFRDFFGPVRGALFEGILTQFIEVFSRDPRAVSLPNLAQAASDDMLNLVPHATRQELDDLSEQLQRDWDTLETLERMRAQHLIHLDALPSEDVTIRKGDVDGLVGGARLAFNRLFALHDLSHPRWSPRPERSAKLTSVLMDLLGDSMDRDR